MLTISAKFLDGLRQSYRLLVTADLYYKQALVVGGMPVVDGSITVDRGQKVRRQGSITLGDKSYFPEFANSPISIYGSEINLKAGIQYPDGTQETVSIGWFQVRSAEADAQITSSGSLPVISLVDRAQGIVDAVLREPIDRGQWSVFIACKELVQYAVPWATVSVDPTLVDAVVPNATILQDSRADAIDALLKIIGAEWYFDANGVCRIVPTPKLTQSNTLADAVWVVDASTHEAILAGANAYGVMIQAKRGITREGVYNVVTAYGQATGDNTNPPLSSVCDTDPRSPTFYGTSPDGYPQGAFGEQGYKYQSSLLTTTAQCTSAANAILADSTGAARSLTFSSLMNPALEAGDILGAIFPDGLYEVHLLDSFTIPFTPSGTFTGNTRTLGYQASGGT